MAKSACAGAVVGSLVRCALCLTAELLSMCCVSPPHSQIATFFRLNLKLEHVKQFINVGPFNAPDVSEFVPNVEPIILFDKVCVGGKRVGKWGGGLPATPAIIVHPSRRCSPHISPPPARAISLHKCRHNVLLRSLYNSCFRTYVAGSQKRSTSLWRSSACFAWWCPT